MAELPGDLVDTIGKQLTNSCNISEDSMATQWLQLLGDLVETIGKKLTLYADYIRLRAVCKSWQFVLPKRPNHLPCQFPLLMLPYENHSRCDFFNFLENKVYHLEFPEARGKWYRGSSHGWIITIERGPAMYLMNPFTRDQIQLPPKYTIPDVLEYRPDKVGEEYLIVSGPKSKPWQYTACLRDIQNYFIDKVVLSSSPSAGSDYVAMAIYGEFKRLAFCRNGDKAWSFAYGDNRPHDDIIFYKGKFFAVRNSGKVVVLDVDGSSAPKVVQILPKPQNIGCPIMTYLVVSSDELLMVGRDSAPPCPHNSTRGFRVFKLDQSSNGGDPWSPVKNLGDRMMFLGFNSSICLSSLDFPGCRGNCIYFTDNNTEGHLDGVKGGHDIGVFNLEDGSINSLPGYTGGNTHLVWPPPIWVTPNPC